MSDELDELPEGWRWAKLVQVAEIGSEQLLPKHQPDTLFNYVALENIEPVTGRLIDFAPTPGREIASNKYKFTSEHVLYGKLRPYLRKALIPDFEGVSATDLLPLRPNPEILDRRFLWRWLLSYEVLEYVVARQTGVKMPRLRTGDLEAMPVPLASLSEQRRIIERVEHLYAQTRAARDAIEKAKRRVEQIDRTVLSRAFRGEL
jgi:type I restriction enzyme S subunit